MSVETAYMITDVLIDTSKYALGDILTLIIVFMLLKQVQLIFRVKYLNNINYQVVLLMTYG